MTPPPLLLLLLLTACGPATSGGGFGSDGGTDSGATGDGGQDSGGGGPADLLWPGGSGWMAGAGPPVAWFNAEFDSSTWEDASSPSPGGCGYEFTVGNLGRPMEWWESEGVPSMWSSGEEQAVVLRGTLVVQDDATSIEGWVTVLADDDFQLWINGERAEIDRDGVEGPDVQLDMSPYLHGGENDIALFVEDSDPDGCRGVTVSGGVRSHAADAAPPTTVLQSSSDWKVYAPPDWAWMEGWWSAEHKGPEGGQAAVQAPESCGTTLTSAAGGELQWWEDPFTVPMWSTDDAGMALFWTAVEIDPEAQVLAAALTVATDDDRLVWVNGALIEQDEDNEPGVLSKFDLTGVLLPGWNSVAIRADDIDPTCRWALASVGVRVAG